MPSEAQKKATMKYQAKNRYSKTLILNRSTDQDLIEYIETVDNFTGLVKKLLREHMKKNPED